MKIANIVLAALVIVAAPAFANTAAVQVSEQAVAAAANRLTTIQIQSAARALNAPGVNTAAALTTAIMAAINSKQISAAALIDAKSKKVTVSDTYIYAAKKAADASSMPVQSDVRNSGGVLNDTVSDVRRGGSQIGSVNDYRPARGEEDQRDLNSLRNHCNADGTPSIISGGCGKLDAASSAVWASVLDEALPAMQKVNITTGAQWMANKYQATKILLAAYRNKTSNKSCEMAKKGLMILSEVATAVNEMCGVVRRDALDQAALADCR